MAVATLCAWLAVAATFGVAAASGASVIRDRNDQWMTGLPGFGAMLGVGAVLGTIAAVIGCLAVPLGLWLHRRWSRRGVGTPHPPAA